LLGVDPFATPIFKRFSTFKVVKPTKQVCQPIEKDVEDKGVILTWADAF
jgi:hypothetical protein